MSDSAPTFPSLPLRLPPSALASRAAVPTVGTATRLPYKLKYPVASLRYGAAMFPWAGSGTDIEAAAKWVAANQIDFVICWQTCAADFGQPDSWFGDHRPLQWIDPDATKYLADLSAAIRGTGAKFGVCIRHGVWDIRGRSYRDTTATDGGASDLVAKIKYAAATLSPDLFYVDSVPMAGPSGPKMLDGVYATLRKSGLNPLLIPEYQDWFDDATGYAVGMPFRDTRSGENGTPARVRAVCPEAKTIWWYGDGSTPGYNLPPDSYDEGATKARQTIEAGDAILIHLHDGARLEQVRKG